jgi:hypothetical protein
MKNRANNIVMTSAITAGLFIRVTLLAQSGNYSQMVAQAQADLSVGRAAQAAAESRQAIILAPTGWQAYLIAGSALEFERQYDQAIDNFTQALEYAPAASKDAVKGMLERAIRAQMAAQSAPTAAPPALATQSTPEATTTQPSVEMPQSATLPRSSASAAPVLSTSTIALAPDATVVTSPPPGQNAVPTSLPTAAPQQTPSANAQTAAAQTPGESETVGVTIAMLPDPPKSAAEPPANITGPSFQQTLQWVSEAAPQNSSPETHDDWGTALYIVPGSTCSKTGFESVIYHKTKALPWGTDWIAVDLGGIDPTSVIATGSHVDFGSANPHIIHIADHGGTVFNPLVQGRSAASVIKAYRESKPFKSVLLNNYSFKFGTPEYASRFANALKHAVEVCGGTSAPPAGQPF